MSAEPITGLPPVDDRTLLLIEATARGMTQGEAAAHAGMPYSTARRRLERPEVRLAIAEARRAVLRLVADRLTAAASDAVAVLVSISTDDDEPAAARVAAARAVLREYRDTVSAADLSDRLERLEGAVARRTMRSLP